MADTERRLGDMVRLLDRMCGTSYRDLSCPHCDRWIGDPDDPDIATVSVEHDIDECERGGYQSIDTDRVLVAFPGLRPGSQEDRAVTGSDLVEYISNMLEGR